MGPVWNPGQRGDLPEPPGGTAAGEEGLGAEPGRGTLLPGPRAAVRRQPTLPGGSLYLCRSWTSPWGGGH